MEDSIEILSDSSASSKTVDYEYSEVLQDFLEKNGENKKAKQIPNKYTLDISDDEFIFEPLESRLKKDKLAKSFIDNKPSTSGDNLFSSLCINKQKNLYEMDSSSSDDDENKKVGSKFNLNLKEDFKAVYKNPLTSLDADFEMGNLKEDLIFSYKSSDEDINGLEKSRKRHKKTAEDKAQEKLDKERRKKEKAEERARERELKKHQKENEKQMKSALKVVENCIKPDQCAQYITVNIDENLFEKPYGKVIIAGLENAGYKFKILKQARKNGVTWTRAVPTLENMLLQNIFQDESYFLSILEVEEFIPMIANEIFTGYVQSILSLPKINHATIAILKVEKYFKYLANEKNQEFKAAILDKDKKEVKNKNVFENLPVVKKYELNMALAELQILCKNCYVKFVDNFEDLALFVGECSKAVAQAPYKAEKSLKAHKSEEFFQGHNKDCVKVDKDGNGLSRLWSQILKSFPLASLETSEAIIKAYPTLKSLVEAYRLCATEKDKQNLLQDIQVRRAAGPLANTRRIGPELSRKYYLFFAQKENLLI